MRLAVLESLTAKVDLREPVGTLDPEIQRVLTTALAASELDAFDPMERAIHEAATLHAGSAPERLNGLRLVHEYDLTPELTAVTHVWQAADDQAYEVAVKGAPETLFALCRVPPEQKRELLERVASHAVNGLRVLAVASGRYEGEALPRSPSVFRRASAS